MTEDHVKGGRIDPWGHRDGLRERDDLPTRRRAIAGLHGAFAHAKETGRLSFAPHVPRQSHAHENARQGFLERPDFDAILEKIPDEDFRDYLEWFWWTGMRPGELASLTWNAYDAQTKTLRLAAADAKIGQGRVVPVIGPLAAIIERREAKRIPSCRLVFHSGGQRMTRSRGGLPRSACWAEPLLSFRRSSSPVFNRR